MVMSNHTPTKKSDLFPVSMLAVMGHIPPQALFVLPRAATRHISSLMETKGPRLNKERGAGLVLKDWRTPFPNSKIVNSRVSPEENHREEDKGVVENI